MKYIDMLIRGFLTTIGRRMADTFWKRMGGRR